MFAGLKSVVFLLPVQQFSMLFVLVQTMELLSVFEVSCELSKDEFLRHLRCENSSDQIRSLREPLLMDAVRENLTDGGDVLVSRRE